MKNYINISESTDIVEISIEDGYQPLSGKEIKETVVGKQYLGDYLRGFKYIISIHTDGRLEGKNNYQHYDVGRWSVDEENDTMSVMWERGWDTAITQLYRIGDEIKMHDIETKEWRTSLTRQLNQVQNIEQYQF